MICEGDILTIHEDPLTKSKPEGRARVVDIATPAPKDCWLNGKAATEYHLQVVFLECPEDGEVVRRYFETEKEKLLAKLFELNGEIHAAMCNLGNCLRATGEAHQPEHAGMDFDRIQGLAAKGCELSKAYNDSI